MVLPKQQPSDLGLKNLSLSSSIIWGWGAGKSGDCFVDTSPSYVAQASLKLLILLQHPETPDPASAS